MSNDKLEILLKIFFITLLLHSISYNNKNTIIDIIITWSDPYPPIKSQLNMEL